MKLAWLLSVLIGLAAISPAHAHSFTLHRDLVWNEGATTPLQLDLYVPNTDRHGLPRPVLLIFHGGGWLINDRKIMRQMAEYLASHSELLVVNADYRLLGAEQNRTLLSDIVADALGAVAWVKQHSAAYGGDASKLVVTGDSAGGHLAAMVLLQQGLASWSVQPSYWPAEWPHSEWKARLAVRAAILSYPVTDVLLRAQQGAETAANGFWQWAGQTPRGWFGPAVSWQQQPEIYQAFSPQHLVANMRQTLPPQLIQVAEGDTTTPPSDIQRYVNELQATQQPVTYQVYPKRNHAYLDNGCNAYLKVCFEPDALEPLQAMLRFLAAELGERTLISEEPITSQQPKTTPAVPH